MYAPAIESKYLNSYFDAINYTFKETKYIKFFVG